MCAGLLCRSDDFSLSHGKEMSPELSHSLFSCPSSLIDEFYAFLFYFLLSLLLNLKC